MFYPEEDIGREEDEEDWKEFWVWKYRPIREGDIGREEDEEDWKEFWAW